MYLIATDDGLFRLNEKDREIERLTQGYSVNDAILPYICSSRQGVIVNGETIINEGCWRLWRYMGAVYASIEGPKIYEIKGDKREVNLILDLTNEAKELGWDFPYGPPHITDFAVFKGQIIATVEEGNLLVGDSIRKLRPIEFIADMHNLLVKGDNLLIAAADGLYLTKDLIKFDKRISGYAHGIEDLDDIVVGHIMAYEPLIISKDGGVNWDKLPIRLPRPTFGVTAIAKVNKEKVIYSTNSIYEIDILRLESKKIVEEIPSTRRVIKM
ncbi:hypothetical protein V6M85_01480 [Sulfolobus tengchongensis]|uniref:Uncharacterized protein n=1 Tax=Sulfolobus tengchongensis TaxID=207809 RepID=A0AAX4L258_9CREN